MPKEFLQESWERASHSCRILTQEFEKSGITKKSSCCYEIINLLKMVPTYNEKEANWSEGMKNLDEKFDLLDQKLRR